MLLVLLRSIGHSDGRNGHHHTRGAGPCDQHRQVSLYHEIHPLDTWRQKSYSQGQRHITRREKSPLSTDHRKKHNFFFCIANYVILTSSGFPKAAANVVHSLFRKASGNLLAGKLVSKFMNGIILQVTAAK